MKLLAPTLVFVLVRTAAHAQTAAPPTPPEQQASTPTPAHWRVVFSPATLHYHYSPDHRRVYSLGIETQRDDGYLLGATWFRNSFGQPSGFVYAGRRFTGFTSYGPLYAQLIGGLLYGYKAPFEDKVPFNYNGYSPGAVLGVGWQFTPAYSAQLNFLGNAALMLQFSADFR